MKKYLALLLVAALLVLCGCSGKPAEKSAFELAESCLDKPISELYALIGEPNSFDYAPSCMGEGEDGNLYYDGFIVYTYKEGDSETVHFVE